MLEWCWRGTRFRASLLFPASVVAMLSLDTEKLTAVCLLASLLHEGGHAVAMLLLRDAPRCVTLGVFGLRVERNGNPRLGYPALCAVSLAGPLTNALYAALLCRCSPQAFAVHAVLAGFHLLPVLSLDGGEALYAALCCFVSEECADRVLRVCSCAVLLPMTAGGVALLLGSTHNFSLLLIAGYLILQMFLHRGH